MKLGLAFGGGGARGLAHFGIIKRLEELGVHIDCVCGTSIGAIAAGVMASGNVQAALEWCGEPDWKKLPRLFVDRSFTNKALIKGDQIERQLSKLITARDFREMHIPCAMVATDLHSGEEVVMRSGDVMSAVRASMAIPGVFIPIERDGRVLVDGGLVNPLPVGVCRQLGADKVIAVDITPRAVPSTGKRLADMNIFDVLIDTFRVFNGEMTRRVLKDSPADILLHPNVDDVKILDFRNAERLVEAGRRIVDECLADIIGCIEWQPGN